MIYRYVRNVAYISLIVLLRTYKLICIFQPQRHLWTFFIVLWYLNVWTKDGAGVNHTFFNTCLALVFHIYLFPNNVITWLTYYWQLYIIHTFSTTITYIAQFCIELNFSKKKLYYYSTHFHWIPPKCLGFIFIVRLEPDLSQLLIPI